MSSVENSNLIASNIEALVNQPELRQNSMCNLLKNRYTTDLAPMLLSSGAILILKEELSSTKALTYPANNPAEVTYEQCKRVCSALSLLQCVAANADTRAAFWQTEIPLCLMYRLSRKCEDTKLADRLHNSTLSVYAELVKGIKRLGCHDDLQYLLSQLVVLFCVHVMDSGSNKHQTAAVTILHKLLLTEGGLEYIRRRSSVRVPAILKRLQVMVDELEETPSPMLLQQIVGCYFQLTFIPEAMDEVRSSLPPQLRDGTFTKEPDNVPLLSYLQPLLKKLNSVKTPAPAMVVFPTSNK